MNNDTITSSFIISQNKTVLILSHHNPSRDTLIRHLNVDTNFINKYDTVSNLPPIAISKWKTVYFLLDANSNWLPAERDSLKSFIDNAAPGPDRKTLLIFGDDLGYLNDPVSNPLAEPSDTLFYRQYLHSKYISNSWLTAMPSSNNKCRGYGVGYDALVYDSLKNCQPDLISPVNGSLAAFIPSSEDSTGDSCNAVIYIDTDHTVFYGTNTYSNYFPAYVKVDETLDWTINIGPINITINNGITININIILPIELSYFNSITKNTQAILNWSTVSEENNSGFNIERKSRNSEWSTIGHVNGAGNSVSTQNYSYTDNNLTTGTYNYRLKQTDFNGNFKYYYLNNEVVIGVPGKFELSQNYPNPFNPSTKINYSLPVDSRVMLKIYDITGREIYRLVNEQQNAGYHTVQFNADGFSTGVYFYQLEAGNFSETKKLILIK